MSPPALPPALERLALDCLAQHGCHTAILYGSWARGDADARSDLDLLLVREGGDAVRDARRVDGVYLDAFVSPEAALAEPDPALLRILGGRVLVERQGYGTALLARVQALYERGPTPLTPDNAAALRVWSQKTLERLAGADDGADDVAADYRRAYLLAQSLEDYFALRGAWCPGEKAGFAWLRTHDPIAYAAFAAAGRAGAGHERLVQLVRQVYGPELDGPARHDPAVGGAGGAPEGWQPAGRAPGCAVFIATSLDGYIARADGRIDWLERANATVTPGEDCGYAAFMASVDALVMGRRTFETVLAFPEWPYGEKPVYVLSQTLTALPPRLPPSVTLHALAPEALVALARERGHRRLYVDGGATIRAFLAAGLIDELTVTVIPVLLGSGRPLFGELPADVWLEHAETLSYPFGFVQSRYRRSRAS